MRVAWLTQTFRLTHTITSLQWIYKAKVWGLRPFSRQLFFNIFSTYQEEQCMEGTKQKRLTGVMTGLGPFSTESSWLP